LVGGFGVSGRSVGDGLGECRPEAGIEVTMPALAGRGGEPLEGRPGGPGHQLPPR